MLKKNELKKILLKKINPPITFLLPIRSADSCFFLTIKKTEQLRLLDSRSNMIIHFRSPARGCLARLDITSLLLRPNMLCRIFFSSCPNKKTTLSSGFYGRGDMIRTCDTLVPNQVLYQAELRPEWQPYTPYKNKLQAKKFILYHFFYFLLFKSIILP